jgi:hypothetical protein
LANKQILVYLLVLIYILSWLVGCGLVTASLVLLLLAGLLLLAVASLRAFKRMAKGHNWDQLPDDTLDTSKAT